MMPGGPSGDLADREAPVLAEFEPEGLRPLERPFSRQESDVPPAPIAMEAGEVRDRIQHDLAGAR
jgi:hypothetical protein